jgi:hypothetical protein
MSTILWTCLGAVVPAVLIVVWKCLWTRSRRGLSKSPQIEKLLRPAGCSLQLKRDEIIDSMLENAFAAMVFAGGAVWLAQQPVAFAISFAAPFVLAGFFFIWRVAAKFEEAENCRLGLRGEQAVAEALAEVSESGYRAFHDFVVEEGKKKWNIDHIAVGNQGVFLIETKARSKPLKSKSEQPLHEVMFDGETLQFPRGRDTKSVQQAKRNAKWLENHLRKKTGEDTSVEPLVVLPGWFVRPSVKSSEVKAMNATYMISFLRNRPEKLSAAQVTRIITAIEDNCRTVEF